ncbi:MAG: hypothetical protein SGCHY_003193, partial [Lobulomycetales sp.]
MLKRTSESDEEPGFRSKRMGPERAVPASTYHHIANAPSFQHLNAEQLSLLPSYAPYLYPYPLHGGLPFYGPPGQ